MASNNSLDDLLSSPTAFPQGLMQFSQHSHHTSIPNNLGFTGFNLHSSPNLTELQPLSQHYPTLPRVGESPVPYNQSTHSLSSTSCIDTPKTSYATRCDGLKRVRLDLEGSESNSLQTEPSGLPIQITDIDSNPLQSKPSSSTIPVVPNEVVAVKPRETTFVYYCIMQLGYYGQLILDAYDLYDRTGDDTHFHCYRQDIADCVINQAMAANPEIHRDRFGMLRDCIGEGLPREKLHLSDYFESNPKGGNSGGFLKVSYDRNNRIKNKIKKLKAALDGHSTNVPKNDGASTTHLQTLKGLTNGSVDSCQIWSRLRLFREGYFKKKNIEEIVQEIIALQSEDGYKLMCLEFMSQHKDKIDDFNAKWFALSRDIVALTTKKSKTRRDLIFQNCWATWKNAPPEVSAFFFIPLVCNGSKLGNKVKREDTAELFVHWIEVKDDKEMLNDVKLSQMTLMKKYEECTGGLTPRVVLCRSSGDIKKAFVVVSSQAIFEFKDPLEAVQTCFQCFWEFPVSRCFGNISSHLWIFLETQVFGIAGRVIPPVIKTLLTDMKQR
ncbi:hypothetical protein QAD02_003643 [Eretmocerus hayati]|uniref:Uncharacterized protein n=1 Tax=Eretmocerus hayati TaxID=131215 RepID=A0ACC2NMA0_9HYME|nr:hypothetical protein QAD02_003643 [Eretmocerus hayati]